MDKALEAVLLAAALKPGTISTLPATCEGVMLTTYGQALASTPRPLKSAQAALATISSLVKTRKDWIQECGARSRRVAATVTCSKRPITVARPPTLHPCTPTSQHSAKVRMEATV